MQISFEFVGTKLSQAVVGPGGVRLKTRRFSAMEVLKIRCYKLEFCNVKSRWILVL